MLGFDFIFKLADELLSKGKLKEASTQINNLLFILSKATDDGITKIDTFSVDYWKMRCWNF